MVGETKYCLTPTGRPDGFHDSWASGSKIDAFGIPLVLAAAKDQIDSLTSNGGNTDTLNYQSRMFGSFHPGGCHFSMADGSVRFFSDAIALTIYQELGAKDDGLPIGGAP